MSAHSVRCPNCGKRLDPSVRVCPACGVEQPLHIRRVRCNYCGRRVPVSSTVCPNCRHDPRGLYLRPGPFLGLLGAGIILALVYTAFNGQGWFNGLSVVKSRTPTVLAAAQPELIIITATPVPSPTSTQMPTASPTQPPASLTPTLTPTPTRTATKLIRKATAQPTTVPSATPIPAFALLLPKDGEKIYGVKRIIALTFQPMELQANQWYRVQVDFMDRDNRAASWCGWTKGTTIRFPVAYYDDSWQLDRTFRWHVNIAASNADPPSTCAAEATILSLPSAQWVFYWY